MAATYLTLAECKAHLRVDFTDDDTYIGSLAEMVEVVVLNEIKGSTNGEGSVATAGSKVLTGTETNFTDFAVGDTVTVAGETTRTIDSITNDTLLTVTSNFANTTSGVTYIMHGGFPLENGDLPLPLRHAMLLMLGHFYMNREPVSVTGLIKVPQTFDFLIAPYKNWTVR
jgi:hypothetical protein